MIVSLSYIYLYVYLFTLSFIFFLIIVDNSFVYIKNLSTHSYILLIKKYSKFSILYMLCIITLSGLPPSVMFLLKINILSFITVQSNIFILLGLFLTFLINMFFYCQIFLFKNYKNTNLLKIVKKTNVTVNCFNKDNFYILYLSIFFLAVFILSIFFYLDVMLYTV